MSLFHHVVFTFPQDGECLRACDEQSTEAVRKWVAEQDGQRILCTTPSVLLGFRVQVYRSEGTTQWYTAVIVGYNETTRVRKEREKRYAKASDFQPRRRFDFQELTVTDDTVLEEHSEDPSLVHITIIGDRGISFAFCLFIYAELCVLLPHYLN